METTHGIIAEVYAAEIGVTDPKSIDPMIITIIITVIVQLLQSCFMQRRSTQDAKEFVSQRGLLANLLIMRQLRREGVKSWSQEGRAMATTIKRLCNQSSVEDIDTFYATASNYVI